MTRFQMPLPLIASCIIAAAAPVTGTPKPFPSLTWSLLPTNTTARFRGLAAVSDSVAWVAGTSGTVLLTTDGGQSWASLGPTGAGALEFRDIEASSASAAAALSIGSGPDSRVYATADGGLSWTRAFTNDDPAAFYDCAAFSDALHGLAVSDPVDGKFRLVGTSDGGASWAPVDNSGMPAALDGEFGFAASGTCLTAGPGGGGGGTYYLATGGVDPGRVFRSRDGGRNWEVAETPVAGGAAAGVFSVQFRDGRRGIAVGGDYTVPNGTAANAAWSEDGGETWQLATALPSGYRSGSSWVPGRCNVALAVGPTGSDITVDGGRTWRTFDGGTFDSVQCPSRNVCWASGEKGRVARLILD